MLSTRSASAASLLLASLCLVSVGASASYTDRAQAAEQISTGHLGLEIHDDALPDSPWLSHVDLAPRLHLSRVFSVADNFTLRNAGSLPARVSLHFSQLPLQGQQSGALSDEVLGVLHGTNAATTTTVGFAASITRLTGTPRIALPSFLLTPGAQEHFHLSLTSQTSCRSVSPPTKGLCDAAMGQGLSLTITTDGSEVR